MNKNIYRVIFSKARGLLVVVGETAKSQVKAGGSKSGHSERKVLGTMKPLYFSVLLAFGLVSFVPSHAQIVSGAGGPNVGQAQNGVAVVNINKPSSAGVSHNKYNRFDVQQNGAILNNGRTSSQTQLAGWVQGNPNLAGGTARVILNEVNSGNPSHLRGYLEVAGARAQVIVANPAGITCNGCGFINANRATMTTGTPIMNDGRLDGFNVRGGSIQIEGAGLDGSRNDFTDLIARTVEINASVHGGKELRVTAGANKVNADNTVATPITADPNDKPQVAIDVAHLGGMYAGKIVLIGTEHGVGVRNAGEIGAGTGELVVTASGRLENTGTMLAGTHAGINTAGLKNEGQILSGKDISLNIEGDVTNQSAIQANGDISMKVAGSLTNESAIGAAAKLDIQAASIDNTVDGELIANTTRVVADSTLTNRGVIDGNETYVAAQNLTNTGTGAIFGDHVVISADTLTNREEGDKAAIIAARERMDIAANNITNREDAMLISMGDMAIGGTLDESRQASGSAVTINNNSATIEAEGNLDIAAATINNTNEHLKTTVVREDTVEHFVQYAGRYTRRFDVSEITMQTVWASSDEFYYILYTPDGSDKRYTMWSYDRTYTRTAITETAPGKILAGGGISLFANTINNRDSHILAGGALSVLANNINNYETPGYRTYTDSGYSQYFWYHDSKYGIHTCDDDPVAYNSGPVTTSISLGSMEYAGDKNEVTSGTQLGSNSTVSLPNNSLFSTNPDVTASYLVETNPLFANYKKWISSDYMLSRLGLDLTGLMKRLGDGYYEQKLVQEQVAQLTGRRFLEGYASNEQQYQNLLDNGVTYAMEWDLRPGVALSDTQVAQLTSDIVWLVEKEVALPNGETTRALVPQVYLKPRDGDLTGSGALIAANTVNINLTGDMTNQGTIAGREVVAINAENINNLGGRITGDSVGLLANADINNIGGTIDAINHLEVTAAGNINVASTTVTNEGGTRTDIDRVAGLYITGSMDGVMLAYAGNDININGALVSNNSENGITALHADNNLNLGTVATSENFNFSASGIKRQESSETQVGSTIAAKGEVQLSAGNDLTAKSAAIITDTGNITLVAGNDVNLTTATNTASVHEDMKRGKKSGFSNGEYALESGTTIQSGNGNVNVMAGNDFNARGAYVVSDRAAVNVMADNNVNLTASEDHVYQDNYFKVKQKGFLSKKTTTTYDVTNTTTNQGTIISGNTAEILAGNDVNILGSHVISSYGTGVYAGNDINITAATDTVYENHYQKKTKSGIFSGGGLGITIGSQKQSNDNKGTSTYASASTIGSLHGDVNLIAANNYTQTGSHIQAPEGDINIKAKKVDITEARETNHNVNEYKFKQSGISVSITNPVVSTVQTGSRMSKAAKQTDDSRMKAMAATATGLAAYDAYGDVLQNPMTAGGINVSISLGTSKNQSTTTSSSSTSAGSTVMAGNNINIEATGGGKDSDLTIRGSTVVADNNVSLKADNNVNILAAMNTAEMHSTNKSSGGSIGISFGTDGFMVNASVSKGKGKADGTDVFWTNSQVHAGELLVIQSGVDTNMIGAVASGNQVIANIGGDLTIASLQDTSQYKSQQKNIGAGVSVGAGKVSGYFSSSNSKAKGDYASVVEQSGIRTGDDGFQIKVKGDTSLNGGIIVSSDKAIVDEKNILSTGTLSTEDIHNHAEANAKANGITLDSDMVSGSKYGAVKGVISNAVNSGEASGSSSGETRSAVSDGTVIITDENRQLAMTGTTVEQTISELNRDTENAHQAAEKQDIQKLEQQAQAEQAIKVTITKEAIKFTDDAYRKKFIDKAEVRVALRDENGNVIRDKNGKIETRILADDEKQKLKPAADNKVYVATNGIFNSPEAAMEYAAQHAKELEGPLYLVYFPKAKTELSDLMIAGYQYFMENDFMGLTNATQQTKEFMEQYGQSGLVVDGHSRGGMTIGNALDSLAGQPGAEGSMAKMEINLYGSAYSAEKADGYLAYLQDRGGKNPEASKIQSSVHFADFVGVVIGGNAPTGGTLPIGLDGKPISQLREALNIMFGDVTSHSCYGSGKAGCSAYWNNPPLTSSGRP